MAKIKLSNNTVWAQSAIDGISGIDTSNLLSTITSATTYTATQDCIVTGSGYNGQINISGNLVWPANSNAKNYFIILKQGQTLDTNGANSTYVVKVWGLKK